MVVAASRTEGPKSLTAGQENAPEDYPGVMQAWSMVVVLTLFYVLSLLDRNILSLLIEPIKQDLQLSDVQLSLFYGLAFSFFYATGSLPLGWAVDRYSRRGIIFGGVVVWSLATAACGLARSFGSLFAARAGVGVGEAAIVPAGQSIIADSFPAHRMALPMSVYGAGTKLGTGISFIVGGALIALIAPSALHEVPLLGSVIGWQLIFIVAGLPGVAIAFLIFLVPEPRRLAGPLGLPVQPLTYRDYARFFWLNRKFMISLHVGQLLMVSVVSSMTTWAVPFLARVHQWPISYAGFVLGPLLTVGPLLCVPLHGILVDRAFGRGIKDAHLRHLAIVSAFAAPIGAIAFFMASPWATLALMMIVMMLTASFVGLGNTAIQLSIPAGLRGKAASVQLVLAMLAGFSLGSSGPALISDKLFGNPAMIGAAVSIYVGTGLTLAALAYSIGRKPMREHFARRADAVAA